MQPQPQDDHPNTDRRPKDDYLDTYLYTTEDANSRERAENDKRAKDPTPERAVAILQGGVGPKHSAPEDAGDEPSPR